VIPFSHHQIEALRSLSALWPRTGWCMIGASALACHLDLRWRQTSDIDLVLAVDLDAFPAGLDQLAGWSRDVTREHQWHGPGGVQVDLLPAGADLLRQGHITWKSGHRMSLVGMRHALAHAVPVSIASDLSVRVAPLRVIALLKMVAYLDRPHDRERDLEDIGQILEDYVPPDDLRRFGDDVPDAIAFECRPAFLLGCDLAPLLDDAERAVTGRFIELLRGVGTDTTRSRIKQRGPDRWRVGDVDADAQLDAVVDAFQAGLDSIRSEADRPALDAASS
jgi:predicted nucleotidyltransferase